MSRIALTFALALAFGALTIAGAGIGWDAHPAETTTAVNGPAVAIGWDAPRAGSIGWD
ncbi:hypothetical protein GCM10010302_10120 [Streptomyces polychromogenes]|uniref:Uncharacterized protein n=1 Tax=Streptomyces polychromogenes TaxID=67342 RepID=A0ABP3ESA3_9ACTN